MTNKILLGAGLLAAASMSFGVGFETWKGDQMIYNVNTGLDNGTETAGYWWDYSDSKDGGQSSVTWPTAKGNEYDNNALDPIIDYCQGVCGSFSLSKGGISYDPFVGIGFNVAGTATKDGGEPTQADASSWGGLCLTYTVSTKASLELGIGDAGDKDLAYDNPFTTLPPATTASTVKKAWADFKQAGWGTNEGGKTMSGEEASKVLASVKFKIQGTDGATGSFNIQAIGPLDGSCAGTAGPTDPVGPVGPTAIKASAVAPVKAMLSGRTLSFSGISSAVSAEVINLQGRVVVKSTVSASSALNLSNLDAGVYMVRVAGHAVDFSQKIILK
ncbi:MAG: T9SS type A sorting domain-containing protein [Fibrobacter sp.]|nr:T9SS type A sorting domain-containing protein [Fibrobacter sp.]